MMGSKCIAALFYILILLVPVSCKKDIRLQHPQDALINNVEQLKSYYKSKFPKVALIKGLPLSAASVTDKESVLWEKAFWHATDNSYVTPVYINCNNSRANSKELVTVLKYLITQLNTEREVLKTYFVYILTKDDASVIEAMLMQPTFSFINSGSVSKDFNGAIINLAENGILHYSYTYSEGIQTVNNSKLYLKGDTEINYADPNEDGCEQVTIEWYWQTWENGVLINEEYLFSTTELQCTPGGGGGQGDTPTTHNPCLGADSLANNAEYKQKFDSLKLKVTSNKEYGVFYKNTTPNSIEESYEEGIANELEINYTIPANEQIDGFMHSHFDKPGKSLSIFSVDDLYSMVELYNEDKIKNLKTFSAGVVTAAGTQYLLRIEDIEKFKAFASAGAELRNSLYFDYNTFFGIKNGNTTEQNELGFLQLLKLRATGLKLFKGNNTFTNWQPIKRSGNTVVNAACN